MRRRPARRPKPNPALELDALLELRVNERRAARARERRELGRRVALGIATPEELGRLFPSRYGRL